MGIADPHFAAELDETFSLHDLDLSPQELAQATLIAEKLNGTWNDVEEIAYEVAEAAGVSQVSTRVFQAVDRKVWECKDCNYWTETPEIKKYGGVCYACSASYPDDDEEED